MVSTDSVLSTYGHVEKLAVAVAAGAREAARRSISSESQNRTRSGPAHFKLDQTAPLPRSRIWPTMMQFI